MTLPAGGRPELRDELLEFIREARVPGEEEVSEDTSLIRSGLIDSTGLFRLAVWVEDRVGHPLDLTRFDPAADWDTVSGIVEFVRRERSGDRGP